MGERIEGRFQQIVQIANATIWRLGLDANSDATSQRPRPTNRHQDGLPCDLSIGSTGR